MTRSAPTPSVYDDIYLRCLQMPSLRQINASSAGNVALPKRVCFTIVSLHTLNRWLNIVKSGGNGSRRRLNILELGCGFGGLSRWIAERLNCRIVAVDGCSFAITVAKRINSHSRITYIKEDFESIGKDIGDFDAIISLDALYQVKDPIVVMEKIRDVARCNAVVVFTVYCSNHGRFGARYQIGDWKSLLRSAGLERERIYNISAFWRLQMRRARAVFINGNCSDDIFDAGDAANAAALATGGVPRRILFIVAYRGCRHRTVRGKDGSAVGVGPVPRRTGLGTAVGVCLQRGEGQYEGGQHRQGMCKFCFHDSSPSLICRVAGYAESHLFPPPAASPSATAAPTYAKRE
jgi:SAM-dependent methyltransferase